MPGTQREPAAAASAQPTIQTGWSAVDSLEPAVETLHRAAGTPVTARLAWWRSVMREDGDAIPVLLTVGSGSALDAAALDGAALDAAALDGAALDGAALDGAALVALRQAGGVYRVTSGRPHSDDAWEIAARSDTARRVIRLALARFVLGLAGPWQLALTGLRHGDDAAWLARQLPGGDRAAAPPVPAISFTGGEVAWGPGIRSGLDRSGQRIRQHALSEQVEFERDPDRLAKLRGEIEDVHLARDHDAGRPSDLDDMAGLAFWRSVYDVHAARGELEVGTLRLDGHLAAYVIAFTDGAAYRVFDGRFAPPWRRYSPGRRLEAAVVDHARDEGFAELDWMTSVAPEKLVASTGAEPRWTVTAAGQGGLLPVPKPRSGHAGQLRHGCAGPLSLTAAAP